MERSHGGKEVVRVTVGRKMFSCKSCSREFRTSQALGGHQNAHKREKSMRQHCMAVAAAAEQHSSSSYDVHNHAAATVLITRPASAAPEEELPATFAWPGSSREEECCPPPRGSTDPDVLDLELKL